MLGPVEFAEKILGLELWTSQRLVAKLVYGGKLEDEERQLLKQWQKGDSEFGGEVKYHPEGRCRELVLVCGVRSSKTFLGGFLASYESYQFLMLPNPYRYYHIIENSPIFGMIAATSRETAKDTVFAQLKPMLQNDFFEAHGVDLKTREARFPDHNFTIRCGASTSSALVGRTTLFAILDELDFLPDTKGRLGGKAVYQAMSKGTTTLNGLNVSLTSPLWVDSQSANLLELADDIENMVAIRQPTWMINPSPNEQRTSPKILAEFKKDPEGAARDYGAKHSIAISPFFRDSELVLARCKGQNAMDEQGRLQDFKVEPAAIYVAAGDPSAKHDAFGMALGHKDMTGKIVVDLAYHLVPDPEGGISGEVDPHDVKMLYRSLLLRAEMRAALFDTYMFMEVRHDLHKKGVEVLQHHVGLNEYQILKNYIYSSAAEGKDFIVLPDYFPLKKELLSLEQRRGRIDHPPNGSKDVADAVAQIVAYLDKVDVASGALPEAVW